MATTTEQIALGTPAPEFKLPGVDGRQWTLRDVAGKRGTVVMFICNHCPYVQAIVSRIVRDMRDLAALGVSSIAISANDPAAYPEDSFAHMATFARKHGFTFPYVYDETQQVARAYGAVCTPEFCGFDADLRLQYHGRLDASGREPAADARRELYEAMKQIASTGVGPAEQFPSMGCSIKWRDG